MQTQFENVIRKETREEIEAKRRQEQIEKSLERLEVNKPADLYESIGGIWGGNSIFYYEKERAIEQLQRDQESTIAERPADFLKLIWDKKWDSMDFSWFQQHKHLSPHEKKKDASPAYYQHMMQYLNASAQ